MNYEGAAMKKNKIMEPWGVGKKWWNSEKKKRKEIWLTSGYKIGY